MYPDCTGLCTATLAHRGLVDAHTVPADGCIAPNLYDLRGSGVRDILGLRVAYLGGHFDALSYSDTSVAGGVTAQAAGEFRPADVAALRKELEGETHPVDLLLTSNWPRHVALGLAAPPASEIASASLAGCPPVADLVASACPRYHVAACAGVYFTRAPYRNKAGNITRFVGLAHIGAQPAANKWLHALALRPASSMSPAEISAATTDTTKSPFDIMPPPPGHVPNAQQHRAHSEAPSGAAPGEGDPQSWRWAMPAGPGQRGIPPGQAAALRAASKRPRPDDAGPASAEATVFVRNIPYAADEDALRGLFGSCGDIVEVHFGVGPDGRPKGFCHIEFRTAEAAQAAIALSGSRLMDREVRVEQAASVPGGGPPKQARQAMPPVVAPGEAAPGCWFCLSNGKDIHLVASIAEHVYLALDKGPLCAHHVLLVPVEHYAATASMPPPAAEELWRYRAALHECFASTLAGSQLLTFERHLALRNKGGNHAHVNCVPLAPAAAAGALAAFTEAAQTAGFAFVLLPPAPSAADAARQLANVVPYGAEYLCITLPDGTRLVHPIGPGERLSMQFGREVCAKLLGTPDTADWRNCVADQPREEERVTAFKALFTAHDPFAASQQ